MYKRQSQLSPLIPYWPASALDIKLPPLKNRRCAPKCIPNPERVASRPRWVHSRRHAAIIGQDSRAYRLLHQRPPSLAARPLRTPLLPFIPHFSSMSPHALTHDKRLQKPAAYVVGDCRGTLGSFPVFSPYELHSEPRKRVVRKGTSRFQFVPVCGKPEQNGTLMGAGPGALPSAFICAICGSFPAGCWASARAHSRFRVQGSGFKVQRF